MQKQNCKNNKSYILVKSQELICVNEQLNCKMY